MIQIQKDILNLYYFTIFAVKSCILLIEFRCETHFIRHQPYTYQSSQISSLLHPYAHPHSSPTRFQTNKANDLMTDSNGDESFFNELNSSGNHGNSGSLVGNLLGDSFESTFISTQSSHRKPVATVAPTITESTAKPPDNFAGLSSCL